MRIFGIDAGIASVGWAVIDVNESDEGAEGNLLACGTWMFDAPETDKERKPKNSIRREKRGQRRVIRRRRQRMQAIRRLLHAEGLLPTADRDALHPERLRAATGGLDPWQLRAEGLDRRLSEAEFAVVLGHIARHRGFRSNAKSRGANAASDESKMLKAIEQTRERLPQWRTIGEMFARDPQFAGRKHNRDGEFSRSILRDDLEAEIRQIFEAQRRLGQEKATRELEQRFAELAFSQRPLQDAEHLVGRCPFFPEERRAARRAYSFELFRLLTRLNSIRLISLSGERRLTAEEIGKVAADFGAQKRLTWGWLRKRLGLDETVRFATIEPKDETRDFVARAGNAAEGSYTLRQVLGEALGKAPGEAAWRDLTQTPEILDEIAAILSFRSDHDSIRRGIENLGLSPEITAALLDGLEAHRFDAFAGAGHISAKAARSLIPHLARGLDYAEACAAAGFDHAARPEVNLDDVRNPVARKAVSEVLKQVRALIHEFGRPDRIHVELARDVGKSAEERREIERGIEKRNKERDRLRAEFEELIGRAPNADELLRFELWKEQNGRCLYTDREIPPARLVATDNTLQVDHILPWSRFGDDSFLNKTLCYAQANAEKGTRTPFEWFQTKPEEEWRKFVERVRACGGMKNRKKDVHYLLRDAASAEERFRNRNLNDTRYAARLVLDLIERRYYADQPGRRHVFARPGALIAKLRRGFGLEALKKDERGERREDDRHHALDAIVVAACSESMLQRLTRAFQEAERRGLARDFQELAPPWPGFRDQAIAAIEGVFVARPERRRARGEAHEATIRQVRERDGQLVVFERRKIEDLKLEDLERIKDPERNRALIASLRAWIEAGKPKEAEKLPRSPKGDVIRKVRLAAPDIKPAIALRGGTAKRGNMPRIDLFRDVEGKFYAVPIYAHQIVTQDRPPDRAAGHKDESEWPIMGEKHEFLFSLYPNSLVEVTKSDGSTYLGYYKRLDRDGGKIVIAEPHSGRAQIGKFGLRTLRSLRKFAVDRLGRRAEILRETRTWRGVACT